MDQHPRLPRDPHGHLRRPDHPRDARLRHLRRLDGDDLLDRIHARRPALRLVLRHRLALHRLDARAGSGGQPADALLRLGARRTLFDAPDRLLQRQAVRRRSLEKGLHHDARRRRRAADRHHDPVLADAGAHLQHPQDPGVRRGRRDQSHLADRRGALHLRRGGRQVGAVPAARLAAGRDGGPDAGVGADPRGDDGRRRRVSRRPHAPAVRAGARSDEPDPRHRPDYDGGVGADRPGAARHQARGRLLDAELARTDVRGAGCRRGRRGDAVSVGTRVLQGPPLPRLRVGDPRDGGAGSRQARRIVGQAADYGAGLPRRDAGDGGAGAVLRLLGEGRDPRRPQSRTPDRGVDHRPHHTADHGDVHGARLHPHLPRTAQGPPRPRARARVRAGDDAAACAAVGARGGRRLRRVRGSRQGDGLPQRLPRLRLQPP